MRLLMNLGNQDVHVQESGTTEDFLFRHKDDFKKRAGELVELFSDEEPEKLIPDEEGCFPSPLFYRDEAKNGHTIEAIHFCILEADIKAIQNLTEEPIDAVTLFVTSQEEERLSHQDTLDLALLLEGPYGKSFFPGIRFDHRTLTCDPSDYAAVYQTYAAWFQEQEISHIAVVIAQGTPAMCFSLANCSVMYCRDVQQFYAAHIEGRSQINPLRLFTEKYKEEAVSHYCELLDRAEYVAAVEYAQNTILKNITGIDELGSFFVERNNYNFDAAWTYLQDLANLNGPLHDLLLPVSTGIDTIQSCFDEKGNLQYEKPSVAYLLHETLQNSLSCYESKNYNLAFAYMTSFLDIFQTRIISIGIGNQPLRFNRKTNSFPALDIYLNDYLIPHKSEMSSKQREEYKDIFSKWDDTDKCLQSNGPSLSATIKWLSEQPNMNTVVVDFFGLQYSQHCFQNIRNVRNTLPIAHGGKGIGEVYINKKLTENGGMEFPALADKLEELIWKMDPSLPKPLSSYHLIGQKVREVLIKQI